MFESDESAEQEIESGAGEEEEEGYE